MKKNNNQLIERFNEKFRKINILTEEKYDTNGVEYYITKTEIKYELNEVISELNIKEKELWEIMSKNVKQDINVDKRVYNKNGILVKKLKCLKGYIKNEVIEV